MSKKRDTHIDIVLELLFSDIIYEEHIKEMVKDYLEQNPSVLKMWIEHSTEG
jgi:ABC-type proline/glycine betaine transport system substrate-binding protein